MSQRLKLVKGAARRTALVYGMRLFDAKEVASVEDAQVHLSNGTASRVTMHLMEGTPAQIRRQLLQSVDAFFELLDQE